jgi:hypothetical protein
MSVLTGYRNIAPATEAVRIRTLSCETTRPLSCDACASAAELERSVAGDIAGGRDESRVTPEVIEDLAAAIARTVLLPIDSSFGEAKDVDVVRGEVLAEVFEIGEVFSSRDSVRILEIESEMFWVLGA